MIRADFDHFEKPLIYTPGDNEWTDCHRPNNGAYNPLERLAFDRSVFFDRPGRSLGQAPAPVTSQASAGFPENVQLRRAGVQFATIHVVGSNDGLQPWTGLGLTTATPEQLAAEQARMDNALAVVRSSFAAARQHRDRAVVIFQQADMFDPTYHADTERHLRLHGPSSAPSSRSPRRSTATSTCSTVTATSTTPTVLSRPGHRG